MYWELESIRGGDSICSPGTQGPEQCNQRAKHPEFPRTFLPPGLFGRGLPWCCGKAERPFSLSLHNTAPPPPPLPSSSRPVPVIPATRLRRCPRLRSPPGHRWSPVGRTERRCGRRPAGQRGCRGRGSLQLGAAGSAGTGGVGDNKAWRGDATAAALTCPAVASCPCRQRAGAGCALGCSPCRGARARQQRAHAPPWPTRCASSCRSGGDRGGGDGRSSAAHCHRSPCAALAPHHALPRLTCAPANPRLRSGLARKMLLASTSEGPRRHFYCG